MAEGNNKIQRAIVFQGGGALGARMKQARINRSTQKQKKKVRMVDYLTLSQAPQ
jgi:hypothetical protein